MQGGVDVKKNKERTQWCVAFCLFFSPTYLGFRIVVGGGFREHNGSDLLVTLPLYHKVGVVLKKKKKRGG
jgi:hypothetical protein